MSNAFGRYDKGGRVKSRQPDGDYLNALLERGWDETMAQRELDAEIEAMLDDQNDLGLPDVGMESEESRGGYAMELVARVCGWWPKPPLIHIPSPGAGSDPDNFADNFEEALNALIEVQSFARRGPGAAYYEAVKQDVVAFGRGFGIVLPDPYMYEGYPDLDDKSLRDPSKAREYMDEVDAFTKGKIPPLRLRHLPARRVIPFFDEDGLCEAFWMTTERAYDVVDRAEARGSKLDQAIAWISEDEKTRGNQLLTVIHYANRDWCAEMVGTERSFPPHDYNVQWLESVEMVGEAYPHWLEGRMPIAYHPGMPTPLLPSHKRTVSVVYQSRNIITMLDRLASMRATAVRIWAWPTPVLRTSLQQSNLIEPGMDGRPRPVEITPGLMLMLWPDEEVSFLSWQGAPADAEQFSQQLMQQFNRIGLPPVESGSGDLSGYAAAMMRSYAQGKYQAINTGIRQGWHDLAWIEVDYLKTMPSQIWVPTMSQVTTSSLSTLEGASRPQSAYLRINPEQLRKRNFEIMVTLEPDRSADRIANMQAATAAKALGMPQRMIYEDILGYENPSRILLMQQVEELEQTPEYKQVIFGAALKAGQLMIEQGGQQGNSLQPSDLMQFSAGQLQAMVQAGMIDPAVAQQAIAAQQGNAVTGQTLGAMAGGGTPPALAAPGGPYPGPGGAPGALTAGPAIPNTGALPAGIPASGGLGTLGGAPSPVAGVPQGPRAVPIPSGGRAPGQSRAPYRFQRGA